MAIQIAESEGAVERVADQRHVLGWARQPDVGLPTRVSVWLDGEQIGAAVTSIQRPDIGGANGFAVTCTRPVTAIDLVTGRLMVKAADTAGTQAALPFAPGVTGDAVSALVTAAVEQAGVGALGHMLQVLSQHPMLDTLRQNLLTAAKQSEAGATEAAAVRALLYKCPHNPRIAGPLNVVGQVNAPIGHVSQDGAAVIGLDGQVFLVGGSNELLKQYLEDKDRPETQETVRAWSDLIKRRHTFCRRQRAGFLQVMMPEKATVLHDLLPRAVPTPSRIWQGLEARFSKPKAPAPYYLSLLQVLGSDVLRARAFPRLDSHCSAEACWTVFGAICAALGQPNPFPVMTFDDRVVTIGDLADRLFPGVRLPEIHAMPSRPIITRLPAPELIERVEARRHVGARYVWRTPTAPIDLKVVAFASSSFERGRTARSLSWWFARAFREFHFLWSPELQADYVRAHRPDWVICQTIERFLHRVPES